MIVKFWGVRGSIPAPPTPSALKERLKAALTMAFEAKPDPARLNEFLDGLPDRLVSTVGGNTPCLEITEGEDILIIDAGTGINALGRKLSFDNVDPEADRIRYLVESQNHYMPEASPLFPGSRILHLDILLTHTHWDHIQGFPFFAPIYQVGNSMDIYGRSASQMREALSLQQSSPLLFPIRLEEAGATINFHDFPDGVLSLGPFEIEALPLPHPGGSLAFKVRSHGRTLVFATDYEFVANDQSERSEAALAKFLDQADVFISDTQYTFLESMTKEGWGHSSPLKVAEMALNAGVGKFFLFHHDPLYSDLKLYDMLERTTAFTHLLNNGHSMLVDLAIEGREIEV
ncbi:MAG: MBL fold metallo-hydrolase [Deltaproteobacteria bacterium]|jgi:ribonuclease BN (tRNA processing enzyme)|nr:MBL fold metallo-hydrolase [Deltaproteobacteria bacterium]